MPKPLSKPPIITEAIQQWHASHGRHDLPWQASSHAYPVWLSEIMLQQTQVATVIPYFNRFIKQFPTVHSLAAAPIDEVLHLWTGLGYYARARNLHKAAQMVVEQFAGEFPTTIEDMLLLPGIGKSTAGAILAFSTKQRHAILDGNVKRVLSRVYGVEGWYGVRAVADQLWTLAEANTPQENVDVYTQAIMDFGATHCTRAQAQCHSCPLATRCVAWQSQRVNELPHGKPKQTKPVKSTRMLFVSNSQNEILLQRNPPTGIWGGLWCPPQIAEGSQFAEGSQLAEGSLSADGSTLVGQTVEILGLNLIITKEHNIHRHTFSHYHLDIQPLSARISDNSQALAESPAQMWYNTEQPPAVGLAAPVKKMLAELKL